MERSKRGACEAVVRLSPVCYAGEQRGRQVRVTRSSGLCYWQQQYSGDQHPIKWVQRGLRGGFHEPTNKQKIKVSTNSMIEKGDVRPQTNMGYPTTWQRLVVSSGLLYCQYDCHEVAIEKGEMSTSPRGGEQILWKITMIHPISFTLCFSAPSFHHFIHHTKFCSTSCVEVSYKVFLAAGVILARQTEQQVSG